VPGDVGLVDVGGAVRQLAARASTTCALLETGALRCWGSDAWALLGQPGLGTLGDDEAPRTGGDIDVGGPVRQVAVGDDYTCALLETGKVRCWGITPGTYALHGYDIGGQVGAAASPAGLGDVTLEAPARQISGGSAAACALLEDGRVRCWGMPWPLPGMGGEVQNRSVCVLFDDGTSRCVQATPPTAEQAASSSAAAIENLGGQPTQVATGFDWGCAVLDSGNVRCWFLDDIGYGLSTGRGRTLTATGDLDLGGRVHAVSMSGDKGICALMDSGLVRCWDTDGLAALLAATDGAVNPLPVHEVRLF
jgi:alpha-tubulin suppressor-like RCC1 family protein